MTNGLLKIALILFVVIVSCDGPRKSQDEVLVARVGKAVLTLDQLRNEVPSFLLQTDSLNAVQSYIQNWVQREVLYQEARRLGIHETPDIRTRLENMRVVIVSDALRDIIVANALLDQPITDDEVREYYDRNRSQFVLQERHVRVRHMITATLDDSRDAKNEMLRGADWDMVVDRYSVNKEQALADAREFFPVGALFQDNAPMRDYLRVIGISEISPIRSVGSQFHFIQIVEDRPAGSHPDIDWMFDQIKEWLSIEKRRKAVRAYEQNLLMQAEVNNEIQIFEQPQRLSIP